MSLEEPWYYSISASSFLVLTILEQFYNRFLFDYTLETVPEMQSDNPWLSLQLWSFYSSVGLVTVIILPFVVTYIMFKQRPLSFYYPCAFYYVLMIGSIFFLMNVTKLTYHQERPFWVSKEIEAV